MLFANYYLFDSLTIYQYHFESNHRMASLIFTILEYHLLNSLQIVLSHFYLDDKHFLSKFAIRILKIEKK